MKRNEKTTIILSILLLVLLPLVLLPVEAFVTDPPLVGTTTDEHAVRQQRKGFYANGRYWIFYADGSTFGYCSSMDAETWSDYTQALGWSGTGYKYSLKFNGTVFDLIYCTWTDNGVIRYRRGTPNADGTVTWVSDSVVAVPAGGSDIHYRTADVAIDSSGYPYIVFRTRNSTTGDTWFNVTRSANNDGTWSTASGYPKGFQETAHTAGQTSIVSLTSQRMYAVYNNQSHVWGALYNGTHWESEETVTTTGLKNAESYSVVADDDDVHFAFAREDPTNDLRHLHRVYGTGWGSENVVMSADVNRVPYLSWDSTNDLIYLFWRVDEGQVHDEVDYKTYDGSWSSTFIIWIDESENGFTHRYCQNVFEKDYGGKIAFFYLRGSTSPYDLRVNVLTTSSNTLTIQALDSSSTNLPRQVTFSGTLGNGSSFEETSDSNGNLALTTNGGWTTINVQWGTHTVAAQTTTMIDTSETVNINTYIERLDSDSYYMLVSLDNTDISSAGLTLMGHVNWHMPSLSGSGTTELKMDCANWVTTSEPFNFRLNDFYHQSGWTWSVSIFTYSIDLSSADSFIVEMWWVTTGRDPTDPTPSVIVSPVEDESVEPDVTVSPHILPERPSTFTIAPLTLAGLALGGVATVGIVAYTFNWFRTRDTVESLFNGKHVKVDWGRKKKKKKRAKWG